ncbi:PDGLE domain-containing protein [Methanobrevibacter sp.]|uniref:PDGLE domain-containing protein n=1 Tax=Methanobrevibacter sp. TaxID=66852 RepID=UPI0026E0938F|nr:PDGLE domain-containing protein [Methanobrevibacter sp.]MDO5859959.1 PDGLE domain-containing protein [Methanobrevibacter sp.]
MDQKDKYLIIVAVVICIIICCLSPYIASGDPDGLEKSAEDSGLAEDFSIEEIKGIPDAIFPDYAFANDPDNQALQIVALIIGAIVTLGLGYIVASVVRSRN